MGCQVRVFVCKHQQSVPDGCARHQIRGNNIKWHSHVDYIIKKYYQGGLAACNYQGQGWNDQKKKLRGVNTLQKLDEAINTMFCVRTSSGVTVKSVYTVDANCNTFAECFNYGHLASALFKLHPSLLCVLLPSFPDFFFNLWMLSFLP